MISSLVGLLVMLNPFALFLYLSPIMEDLQHKDFVRVLFKASFISFVVLFVFYASGLFLFEKVFLIDFESFRIFGGIVIFSFAYFFIVKGQRALIHMKESLDDLASEIALPFMVGAGMISLTILLRLNFSFTQGLLGLLGVIIANFAILMVFKWIRDTIAKKKFKMAFDKNMEMLLRINGFFVGAIGIDMIITGVMRVFF